ncbi:DegV family protein [Jeotgalibacillus proteolyticus]|uniref:Fatty acid-binding protein DegV n=1 Tax=Jeotgalibacillus proteolyticus TaxID=2082395 RepID=A0A2S5GDW1_9BACL|nr:DegV family protein [Jeotgalibacillus proteolyticus]PPA71200.1 fatty acid-binding protein DegV [Jeotgalibacillus proteolyticus]
MRKIKIVTDSTVDLHEEIVKKYNITIVPLTLSIDGESFIDRVEITPSEFLEKMRSAKDLPKSSQPSAGAFKEVYDELGSDGSLIFSIHMTGNMSGTVRSAEAAADLTTSDVNVIDSRFISKALSYQVVEAARMAQEGASEEEIIERIAQIKNSTHLFVVVDTLENLVKGGRIGKGRAMIGSLLNIKPIASLANGEYTPVSKARSHSQVVKYLTKEFLADTEGKKIKAVSIVHVNGLGLAESLKEKLVQSSQFQDVTIEETTPIISTHTGEGAIGFMYLTE